MTGSKAPGGTANFEFVDVYHPAASFLGVLSITPPPATLQMGPKKVLDLGFDSVTDLCIQLPGFAGVLGANGRANAVLPIPNLPWLTGLPVYAAMVTIDPTLAEIVEETSPTVSFTIL